VDAIEGPVMVMAGPGTGKTQILALRIANILRQTDTAPEQILAITFTESGVASMRKRLAAIIGSRAYAVVISTFHGFCNDIIKKYPEDFPRIIGSRHVADVEQVEIIEELILSLPLKLLRPFGDPLLYTRAIISGVGSLKREGVTPDQFLTLLRAEREALEKAPDLYHQKGAHQGKMKSAYQKSWRELEKNEELAVVYTAYDETLDKRRLYDYSDMIMEVLKALSKGDSLSQILQEEHQYLLVDEHQDTNNAQNKVIECLLGFYDNPNLFVVGDDKQAIFRFQGASLENFLYFKKRFSEAKLIALDDNYRSAQSILDSAEDLLPSYKPLKARAGRESRPINLAVLDEPQEELFFIATDIRNKIESEEIPAEEIAVLYRDNKDGLALARFFEKLDLPFVIESDEDLLSALDVKKLVIILDFLANFGDGIFLSRLLHLDIWQLPPLEVYKILKEVKDMGQTGDLWEVLAGKHEFTDLVDKLNRWHGRSLNDRLIPVVEEVVRESGLLAAIAGAPEATARFDTLRRFYDELNNLVEAKPEASVADLSRYLDTVRKHQLFTKKTKAGNRPGRVRLMTAHRSKGLEFEQVYIMGAADGHFGGRRGRDLLRLPARVYKLLPVGDGDTPIVDSESDDERRLFYVALTRAKREVTITYSRTGPGGREQVPSAFVAAIRPELKVELDTSEIKDELNSQQNLLLAPSVERTQSDSDQAFVREIFLAQGLSVSALNNYLECPWQYFYRNLVRLPETRSKSALYGTAVHAALAEFFRGAITKELTKKHLLAHLAAAVARAPAPDQDQVEMKERGEVALSGWYDAYKDTLARQVLVEFKIKGILLSPEVRLTGVLDKIEFNEQGGGVTVVDYKTKQPMSRAAIMGQTKTDQSGNFYRQLVFYKLLLDRYEDGKYQMSAGEIDFIEPNSSGKYKKEKFEITYVETKELEDLILKLTDEILSLAFWDKGCGKADCEYCRLRSMLK